MRIPPPIWSLTGLAIMVAADRWWPASSLAWASPSLQHSVGGLLVALGLAFDGLAALEFLRRRASITPWSIHTTSALVTTGLNRLSRNPMYLGLAIWLAGAGLWLGNLLALPIIAGFIILMSATQIAAEEAMLEAKFGQAYLDYKARVRRWI